MVIKDVPTPIWTLRRHDSEMACLARLTPDGIEIDLTSDGDLIVTRSFDTGEEALAWAERRRAARIAQGWQQLRASAG
jgi:hypothetical protein